MLSDIRLARLIRAAETHSERESDSATPRRTKTAVLENALAEPIVNYLLEPYEHGYWDLRASWNSSSPFAKYLLEKLSTLTDLDKDWEQSAFLPGAVVRRMSDEKREELLRVSNRLSSINVLFKAAASSLAGVQPGKLSASYAWISKLDLTEIPNTFPRLGRSLLNRSTLMDFKRVLSV